MSTRCNIIIKAARCKSVVLYHHLDGYPDCVGSILFELCKIFNEKPCFFYDPCEIANYFLKHGVKLKDVAGNITHDTGFELTSGIHNDIDYLYEFRISLKKGTPRYSVKCWNIRSKDYKIDMNSRNEVEIPYSDDDPCHVVLEY